MKPRDFPLALMALLGFVVVIPVWRHFVAASGVPAQAQYIAGLALPAALFLLAAGWIRPELARPVTGVFVAAGMLALAPELWALTGLAADAMTDAPLAETALQLALPLAILAFVASVGWRRVSTI